MPSAIITRKPRQADIEQVELDDGRSDGDVLVAPRATGVTGRDAADAEFSGKRAPQILGRDCIAQVVGRQPGGAETNKRFVTLMSLAPCGTCSPCRSGHYALCERGPRSAVAVLPDGTPVQAAGGVGSLAERCLIASDQALPIPAHLASGPNVALLGESVILATALVQSAFDTRSAESTAVLGCGGLGLAVIAFLGALGGRQVAAVDPRSAALSRARIAGADRALDPRESGHVLGTFDVVFDATYALKGTNLGLALTRLGGSYVPLGVPSYDGKSTLSISDIALGRKTIQSGRVDVSQKARALSLLIDLIDQRKLDASAVVGAVLSLEEVPSFLGLYRRSSVGRPYVAF